MRAIRIWATPILLLLVGLLLIAYLGKLGLISRAKLAANKDAVAAATSVVNSTVIVLSGIMAYLRFFRGRTFARRAILSLQVHALLGPSNSVLHTIVVTAKNVGSAAIWHPDVRVHAVELLDSGKRRPVQLAPLGDLSQWDYPLDKTVEVLDPDEMWDHVAQVSVDQAAWAVTYVATLQSSAGDIWSVTRTVGKQPEDGGDTL